MRPTSGQYTLGSLMVAIAIFAVVFAFPMESELILSYFAIGFVFAAIPLLSIALIVLMVAIVIDRWIGRRLSEGPSPPTRPAASLDEIGELGHEIRGG